MSVFVSSVKIYDAFTSAGGGGVGYLNGCVGDKLYAEIDFYVKWSIEDARIRFIAPNTILLNNETDGNNFIDAGFRAGDTFDVVDSASNDGSYEIQEISADGRTITTIIADTVIDETAEDCSIFGTTSVTDIDFRHIIFQGENFPGFESLTDRGTEQFMTSTGVDVSGDNTNFTIATESWGWVTETITAPNNFAESYVTNNGVDTYKQLFRITHYFNQVPHYIIAFFNNFNDGIKPDGTYPQSYGFKIDAKFEPENPNIIHTITESSTLGVGRWFDSGTAGARANYWLTSITYTNPDSEVVDAPDFNEVTDVTLVIGCSDKFNAGSEIYLNMINCPLNEASYVGTDTTLSQNFFHDRKLLQVATGGQGENNGTDYQVLTNISAVLDSVNQITITFKISYSDYIKSILADRDATDRYFAIWVTTQHPDIATTANNDRVAILADFQNQEYDQEDSTLSGLLDYMRWYEHPNVLTNPVNAVAGREGDYWYNRTIFWVATDVTGSNEHPVLLDATMQIRATSAQCDDTDAHILEETIFDTSSVRVLEGRQTIDIETSKNYILRSGNNYNQANLRRNDFYDTNSKTYYELQYGLALRYENWIKSIQDAERVNFCVGEQVEEVTERWNNYIADGMTLTARLTWRVQGTNGVVSTFYTESDIDIRRPDEAPDAGTEFEGVLQYFDEDGNEIKCIDEDGITTIRATFTGDTSVFPTGGHGGYITGINGFYGYIFIDNDSSSGVTDRVFASTDFESEDSSPFTAATGAGTYKASDNLTLTLNADSIVLETDFDYSAYLGANARPHRGYVMIYARVGYTGASCLLLDAEDNPVLDADLEGIEINCP